MTGRGSAPKDNSTGKLTTSQQPEEHNHAISQKLAIRKAGAEKAEIITRDEAGELYLIRELDTVLGRAFVISIKVAQRCMKQNSA